jgi:hypothetical protein
MRLDAGLDDGTDLSVGDVVFIKYKVIEEPTAAGDVKLQYLPRNGQSEYAARSVNAVFVKRPGQRWLKRLLNRVARFI